MYFALAPIRGWFGDEIWLGCSNPSGSTSFESFPGALLGLSGGFSMIIPSLYSLPCEKQPFFDVHLGLVVFRASPRIFPRLFYSCLRRGGDAFRAVPVSWLKKVPIARY
jgi:hypothetical protein